jgi:hypothetical protein
MSEYFKLISTYDVVLEFSTNTRPVRIEILQSTENPKKLRARVWDQNTYNLYPTFANLSQSGVIEHRLWSSDEVNREITNLLSEDPSDLFWGKEWKSEQEYLAYLKGLISRYHESLC